MISDSLHNNFRELQLFLHSFMLASGTETLNKCVKHPLVALFARIPFLFTAEIKKNSAA